MSGTWMAYCSTTISMMFIRRYAFRLVRLVLGIVTHPLPCRTSRTQQYRQDCTQLSWFRSACPLIATFPFGCHRRHKLWRIDYDPFCYSFHFFGNHLNGWTPLLSYHFASCLRFSVTVWITTFAYQTLSNP